MSQARPVERAVGRGFEWWLPEYVEAGAVPHGPTYNGTTSTESTKVGTRTRLAAIIVAAFLSGLLGVAVALIGWTAYMDHNKVTAMWNVMTRPQPVQSSGPSGVK